MTGASGKAGRQAGGWTVRQAGAADAPAVHRLLAALATELGWAEKFRSDVAALARHGFGPAPLFRALLAERSGAAQGLALYFPEFSTLRGQPGVYVQDLYVAPPARASGLGRRLLAAVVRDAHASWGAAYLRLCAHESNPRALAFYHRLGFETDPDERPLWIEGSAFRTLGGIR